MFENEKMRHVETTPKIGRGKKDDDGVKWIENPKGLQKYSQK
jgi:hypothetical protein